MVFLRLKQQQLENLKTDPSALEAYLDEIVRNRPVTVLDFGVAFESVHYLLTGNLPLEQDMGCGPESQAFGTFNNLFDEEDGDTLFVHKLSPEEVKEISQTLSSISDTQLLSGYKPEVFMEHSFTPGEEFWEYPAGGPVEDDGNELTEGTYMGDDDPVALLTGEFHSLKNFYRKASAHSQAVLVFPNGFAPGCNM
jgi:hypothetical protein